MRWGLHFRSEKEERGGGKIARSSAEIPPTPPAAPAVISPTSPASGEINQPPLGTPPMPPTAPVVMPSAPPTSVERTLPSAFFAPAGPPSQPPALRARRESPAESVPMMQRQLPAPTARGARDLATASAPAPAPLAMLPDPAQGSTPDPFAMANQVMQNLTGTLGTAPAPVPAWSNTSPSTTPDLPSSTPPPPAVESGSVPPNTSLSFLQWSSDPDKRLAFLKVNGGPFTMVHEGDAVAGFTVIEIRSDAVTLSSGETSFTLQTQ